MGQSSTHDPRSQEVAPEFAGQPLASSHINVLIADDNVTNRKLLRTLLESEGNAVLEADNGVTALKFLEQRQVDAVISDILMPGMDGFRLCFEIRRNPKLRKLPFIVYTASYTSASDEKLAMQFGADRFIRKPASINSIVETLYEVVESVQNRDQIEVKIPEEAGVMRAYSQVLVTKLEQTILNLSETNKILAERTTLAEFAMAVSTTLSQCTNLQEMLRQCCAATVDHLGAVFARIWTLNEREKVLELQASSGMDPHINGADARIPIGRSNIGRIASERKPHLTNAVIGDPRVQDQDWMRREGMIAFAGYPLMIADQVVGVMETFARASFSQNTLEIMGSVARSIAVGIQRQFAEEEVRRSAERFGDLAENINEIFFVAAPGGGQFYYVNPAHEQITGQKCAELYQNPHAWLECIHPDDRARAHEALRANSADLDQEYRILRPDREIRWLRSRAYPVKDAEGKVVRVVGIATDITERKQAEEKVNQNLNRIKALHDIDLAITSTLDLATILKALLAKIENVFPYPTVTTVRLLNRTTGELEALACHNVDLDDWKVSFVDQRGGRAYQVLKSHAPLVVRDVRGHSDTVNPALFQKYGLVSYIGLPLIAKDQSLGVLNFYTKQEHVFSPAEIQFLMTLASQAAIAIHNAQLHEQTQRNFERIQAILDSALDCIVTMDRDGKIVEFNPAAEKTFNYMRAEVIGKELSELIIPPSLRERHRRGLEHYLSTGEGPVLGKRLEITAMRADGSEFPAELIVSHSSISGGAPTFTGFIRDISARKHAEEQIQRNLERIRALHEIDVAINSTLDLDTVLRVLLEKIDLFIPYPSVTTVRLRNPETGQFEVLACRNIDAAEWKSEFVRSHGRARRVMETKTPVTVRSLATDPNTHNPDFYRRHGLISYASLPLVVRDEAIGVFNLYTKEEHEFSAEELEFLLTLAGQAAIAINNARLYEHTQRHLRRIQGVSEINTAIASSLSLKNVLDVLLEKTELFCPVAVACGTRLFDEATGNMVPLASRHIPFEEWKQEVASAKGRLTRLLIETKRPVAILNMHTDSRTSMNQFARRHGLVSYLGVPLIVKDKFIGNLVIYTRKEHAFTSEEIEFFSNLGSQAAIAIHNAQLYEEARARETQLQDSNRMLSALHSVAAAANQSLDVNRVLQAAIGKITEIFQFDATRIHLFEGDSGQLVRRASFEKDPERSTAPKPFKPDDGVIGKVAATGQALVFEDIDSDARYRELSRSKYSVRFHDRFVAVFPIRAKSGILGTLTCLGHEMRNLGMAERQLLEAITDQIAAAIENARLFEKNETSNRELAATNRFLDKSLGQLTSLYTALTPLAPSESLGEMVSGIMERLVEATGADASLIRIWNRDAGNYPVIGQLGYPHAFIAEARPERSEGAVGWVLKNNQPIISADIASDARLRRKAQLPIGFQSCAILPLQVHGEVRGVIQLSSRKLRYFDNDQEYHLMAVARQMSIALENRELFYTLRTSRNELEKANKVKDEFLSVMSHELRTPLSVIIGYSGMLSQKQLGLLTTEQDQAVEVIQRNSQELAAMIESIMDATKIEAGSMLAEKELISLSDLLDEIRLAYDFATGKDIRLEWRFADAPPAIWTDSRKLRQILTNLISNAIKFSDRGQIVTSARQKIEPGAGADEKWIEFEVADSGVGIPPEEWEKIFERFHQLDSSGTRRFEGVGLGLYIVKSFSELLGGRVSVRSEVGKGSTFTVRLPMLTAS